MTKHTHLVGTGLDNLARPWFGCFDAARYFWRDDETCRRRSFANTLTGRSMISTVQGPEKGFTGMQADVDGLIVQPL